MVAGGSSWKRRRIGCSLVRPRRGRRKLVRTRRRRRKLQAVACLTWARGGRALVLEC